MSLINKIRYALLTDRLYKISRWKKESVERLRQKRLRRLLRWAVERSPFYHDKYCGIDLDNLELNRLPITTKEEMTANFQRVVTDPQIRLADVEKFIEDPQNLGRWFLGRYALSHTSGTQGPPLLIVQDRRCMEILFATLSSRANAIGRPGVIEGLRRLISPARVAIVTLNRGFYPSGAAFEFMPEFSGRFINVMRLSLMQDDLIARLNEFQPNALVTYASVLDNLVMQSHRLRLAGLRQIANSSEKLTDAARDRIGRAFGVPILDHYGIGECLFLSDGCPTNGGAHVNADWVFLEVVDENYNPVPDGQLGRKVLITNLANFVQPFIRYEVGDCIAMAVSPCRCGNRLPRIGYIEGRAADQFWVRDGQRYRFISNAILQATADAIGSIREWQAIQKDRNEIELLVQPFPNAPLTADAVSNTFRRAFAENGLPESIALDVRIVASFDLDPATGKFRRMINLIGDPADLDIS